MSEIFQGRCPFCGHQFKTRLARKLTGDVKVKVACPKCQEKSVPTDIDGNGTKVLAKPEYDTPQSNTGDSSKEEDRSSNDSAKAIQKETDDVVKIRKDALSQFQLSPFYRITRFISETPFLEFNSLFIGLWIFIIISTSNIHNGTYELVIRFFSGFTDGISSFIATIVVLFLFMIPGGFLVRIKEDKIQGDGWKNYFGTTTNLVSLALVLFLSFSFLGDYSNIQRKDDFAVGQHKARVLLALHDNDCKLADEHYQTYKEARGSENETLAIAIRSCS